MWRWWVAAAAAIGAAWWLWRRYDGAMKGTAKALPVPQGATPQGALTVAQQTGVRDRSLVDRALGSVVKPLSEVGFGSVMPSNLVQASKPVVAAGPTPPKKLPPGSKCPTGKKAMAFKQGSAAWVECR